ncbi:NADH-quinone oxidoreductase subunit M [Isoptericola sediminis]|uniref:NADH-quinone oxidoreductase subunit M n=1 Tax=Isoptericola sediminis TaxID=2733572 RepID=A0A849KCD0_9MICO|nr:NADH-quinone oxidoreductase subunit M [Isoptericola sediminis]
MLLTVLVLLPALAGLVLVAARVPDRAASWAWVATSSVVVGLVAWLWWGFDPGGGFQYDVKLRWIPTVDASYHVGVDGLSLPLLALTAVLFWCCAVWSLRGTPRPRSHAALFLLLQTTCLGTFAALDLILFFLFFDLSIVAMYFVIAGWGHGDRRRSALTFFLYTFLGSLALLLGFIGLFLGSEPRTFDIVRLVEDPPWAGQSGTATWVLLALVVGLAVKTPLVPFHTWLPPAHTDAPAEGSAVLAGVLLKLGTFGFVRIAMPTLPDAWQRWGTWIVVIGVVSVLWGALVALAQDDLKRMIAYTSVNHMGYVLLGLGAVGVLARDGADGSGPAAAAGVAATGAVVQMVSHGLLTGALFLVAGMLWTRGGTYAFARWGGLARALPGFAVLFAVAAFGSLGLPGLSGFVAEFQIFAGSLAAVPVAVVVAVVGILLTAGLFLRALQRLLTGDLRVPDGVDTGGLGAVTTVERVAVVPLLALSVAVGLLPWVLVDVVGPAADGLVALVAR